MYTVSGWLLQSKIFRIQQVLGLSYVVSTVYKEKILRVQIKKTI